MDYDVSITGSGFGDSMAALRLSEKGYRVAVVEMGHRVAAEDIASANRSVRSLSGCPAWV